jgi:peptidoglycan/xylan/chitin deacetylase (PgdA/CDA1 family)
MNAVNISSHRFANQVCLVAMFIFLLASPARSQEVVIAFEDVLGPSATLDGMARTQMIISGLRRAEVEQALFLVRTKKINPRTKNRERLVQYDKAGHVLASHGHDHNLFKKVNLYAYEIDLLKSNALLQGFKNYHGYFHFGYYAAGGDLNVRRKLREFARENGLQPIYVNVKTDDAYLNQKYIEQVNANRRVDIAALEKVYVDMVWQGLVNYYQYAIPTVEQPKIVLLLQENDLAAYFIAPLVEKIREHGWKIASPNTAFGYPKAGRAPIGLQNSDGYMAALGNIDLMANDVPLYNHNRTAINYFQSIP